MTNFVYEDEDGDPVYRVVKRENGNGSKSFYQQHYNGNGWTKGLADSEPVPYHLPLVLDCIERGIDPIWIVEGEKDADNAIETYGVVATTNSGGAGKWRDNHSRFLRGAEKVYIVYDKDKEGYAHAWQVHDSLRRHGVPEVRFRCAREGKDLSDHINAGFQLRDLVRTKPPRPAKHVEHEVHDDGGGEDLLPAAFQLALIKLRELGPVQLEDSDEHQYNALCPAHDDKDPSLTIRPGGGSDSVAVLVHCFAGCESDAIAKALNMPPNDFTVITDRESAQDRANRAALITAKARDYARKEIAQEAINAEKLTWAGDSTTAADEWKIPLEPTKWLVEGWVRYSSSTLLVADPKAGKTRLSLNLVQNLTENSMFLGKFQTTMPEGARVWYGNYDMPDNLFREYMHDYTWANLDGFIVKHISGGQFPFWQPDVFDEWVEYALRMNIHVAIFDTLQVAMQGMVTDENSNTEVGEFVAMLRKLMKAAKVPHLIVIHHRGKSQSERGRGASTLDAAFDGLLTLQTGDRESHDAPRTLKAKGRGIGQAAIELVYDMATETYSTELKQAGAGSKPYVDKMAARYAEFCRNLKTFFDTEGRWPGATVAQRKCMPGDNDNAREKLNEAIKEGYVIEEKAGNKKVVSLTDKGLAAVNADR
jgi:hypothetical protein